MNTKSIYMFISMIWTILVMFTSISFCSYDKLTKKQKGELFLGTTAIILAGTYIYPNIYILLLFVPSLIVYRTQRHKYNLLTSLLGYALGVLSETLLCLIEELGWHITVSDLTLNPLSLKNIIHLTVSYLIVLLLSFLFSKFIKKYVVKLIDTIPAMFFVPIFLYIALFAGIIFFSITAGQSLGYSRRILITNAILFGAIFIVSIAIFIYIFRTLKSKLEADRKVESYNDLKNYTDNLENVYNNLRSFKHDYVNILTSLSYYINEGNLDELKKYFNSSILPQQDFLNRGTAALNNLMHIKLLELKSLLSVKLMNALSNNITVTLDVPEDIDHINMDPVDMIRIIGIYLDNAIEAAKETAAPVVNVHMANIDNGTAIIISNNYVDKGLSLQKMSQLHVSTKGEGRGIGLYNVEKIFANYENIFHETNLESSGDDHLFVQHLRISD